MPTPDFQQLNALAELAADHVQRDVNAYIATEPSLNESVSKEGFAYHLGEKIASEAAGHVAEPLCKVLGDTVGKNVGAAIGTLFPPPFELPAVLLLAQGGRIATEFTCNKTAQVLGKMTWKTVNEAQKHSELEQAKTNLSSRYDNVRSNVLTTLLSNQSPEAQNYLRDQFNRQITQQPFYSLLSDDKKSEIKQERLAHKATLLKQDATYQAFVKQSDEIDKVTLPYLDRVNDILKQPAPDTPVSPKAAAENDAFFKEWKAENTASDNQTQHKLNAVLHAQKQYNKDMKEVLAHNRLQEKRYQQQLEREAAIATYRGVESGFNFISQLGIATNNRAIATIGSIGASVTSIAFNAAMISGSIPGIALSGWGLLGPYAAIGMAGLGIVTTLFGKKKKDDPQMKALQALSQQMENFRQDVHRWILQLGDVVVDAANDIKKTMETNNAIVKTALSDGFNAQAVKLEEIQSDLNRLATLSQKSISATFLQEFSGTVSDIEQLIINTADRKREIETSLRRLTTWLVKPLYLRNTNGTWCLPEDLTSNTVFSPPHLRDHDNLLDTDSNSKLGYLGKLASLTPGLTFNEVDTEELPNSVLFLEGVETYAQGRLHLGTTAAKTMDPHNEFLNTIKRKVDNGLRFMAQLVSQEPLVLSFILTHYEQANAQLKTTMITAARDRLTTNTIPGFEFSLRAPLNSRAVAWPTAMISRQAGYNPLPFKQTLLDAVKAKSINIPKILQAALNAGVGKITAYYTHSGTGAHAKAAGENWNYCHWIQGRTVTFTQIEVGYELNGFYYSLYTTSSHKFDEGEIGKTAVWKHKNPGEYDNNNSVAAGKINSSDQNPLLATAWNSVGVTAINDVSNNDIPDKLKSAIIEGIVTACIVNHPTNSPERTTLVQNILSHIETLNGLPRDFSSLKALLLQFASLTNAPVKEQIKTLWGEAEFIAQAVNYQLLDQVITDLRNTMQATPANSQLSSLPLVQTLTYCSHLLDAIKHHESVSTFVVSAELSEALQVDEEVIFDPQRLDCDITPANKLGAGSFGEVYLATDRQTGNPLAVKLLYSGTKLLESARGELEVIARLTQANHPSSYLVSMLGVTQFNDREAIVMEFVPNGTLGDHLYTNNGSLSVTYRLKIAKGLIAGLSYLHEHGIIHGDLKDVNLLLTTDYQPKIADYGLARVASDTQSRSSRSHSTKTLTGTLLYMAPELFDPGSTGHPTKESDIYALGVILWQILTLEKPFAELNPTFQAIAIYWVNVAVGRAVTDHFKIPPEPQEPEAARLHRFFAPMISECRSINPTDRPSAQELQLRQ